MALKSATNLEWFFHKNQYRGKNGKIRRVLVIALLTGLGRFSKPFHRVGLFNPVPPEQDT